MKPNPPTLKTPHRYVLFKVYSTHPIEYYNLKNAVYSTLLDFLGESGTAKAGIRFIKNLWEEKVQRGVIKCSVKYVDILKVSLGLIHQIGDERILIRTLRISGTIKGLKMSKPKRK